MVTGGPSRSHEVTKSFQALATTTAGAPRGSRLPAAIQEVVARHLRDGLSISETARRAGVSRDQVRTVRYAMFGLTLAEVRTLKRESKAEVHACACPCHRTSDGSLCPCQRVAEEAP